MRYPNRLHYDPELKKWRTVWLYSSLPDEPVEVYTSPKFRIVRLGVQVYVGKTTGLRTSEVSRVKAPGSQLLLELLGYIKEVLNETV